MKFYRPLPINKEIKLNSRNFIVSKTDYRGNILYANDTFCEVTGYTRNEVLGAPHNILRHPDMPSAVFFLMWQSIQKGNNICALVKNLAKTGEYYWVSTNFEIHTDPSLKTPTYIAYRRSVSAQAIKSIEPLYETLLGIEKKHGVEASLLYLQGYLDERHSTFDELMNKILQPKGLMAIIFNKMRNSFAQAA